MENQSKVSSYHQKKVISSIFNLLLFNDYKTPSFQIIDGVDLTPLCDNTKKIIEFGKSEELMDNFLDQFHKKIPKDIRHQAFLMMFSRPTYSMEVALFLNFKIKNGEIDQENFKIGQSMMVHRPDHPLVKAFIGELLLVEDGYQIHQMTYIEKEWYNSTIEKQIKKYNDSLVIF